MMRSYTTSAGDILEVDSTLPLSPEDVEAFVKEILSDSDEED
jgi:hypothetical protein